MTEQTKAVFENPQLLREKLSEYFDTSNEKIIEKYALVAEKMFEKGNKEKLKMYFNEWSVGVWVAAISLFITILGLTLSIFGISFSYIITYGAIAVFGLTIFGHVFILAYRGYIYSSFDLAWNFLYVFVLIVVIVGVAITFGRFVLDFGIIWVAIVFVFLPIFSLFGFRYLFVKELVIKNIAKLLDNAVKNAERKKVRKFFFISVSEFKKGGGRNFFKTIFMTIFAIVLLGAIAGKGIKESEKKRLAEKRVEQRKTMLNKEQSQTEKNTIENTIENAKKLLDSGDKQKAQENLSILCANGNGEACHFLANIIDDEKKSIDLYEKACNSGYYFSCSFASELYAEKENYEMAMKLIQKGCDNNNYASCMELASLQDDQEKADELYQKASYLAHTECNKGGFGYCEMLGEMYQNGQNVMQDNKTAMKYYSKACDGKQATSCVALGFMLKELGNLQDAKEYFGRACDIGGLGGDRGCELYKELNN